MPQPAAPSELLHIILEFIQTDSWPDLQRIVKAHPELLSDEVEELLAELAAAQEEDWVRQLIENHRTFLTRCREVGVGGAFAERMGGSADLSQVFEALAWLATENLEVIQVMRQAIEQAMQESPLQVSVQDFTMNDSLVELANVVREYPIQLSDEADEVIRQGIQSARALGQEDMARYIEERYESLHQLYKLGAPAMLAAMGVAAKNQAALTELAWRGIQSAEELERAQARYPELQTALVRATAAMGEDEPEADYRMSSTRATGAPVEVPPSFEDDITALHSLPDTYETMEKQIEIYRRILRRLNRAEAPVFWGAIQNNLANVLRDHIRGDRAENLEQAIHHYQQALQVYTRADFPADWAMTQNNLAVAFYSRIRGGRAENLERAIHHYQQALEVRTRADFPLQWANTQNNLATALRDRIRGDRAENMKQAIHHYQQALEIYTHADFPMDWAMIQNNLGVALANHIHGDWSKNLERALAHFQAALQVYTRADFPVDWATTQNNLGNALRDRICGDRAENLEKAIAHFQAALEVYTRTDFPVQWATTQNNLGNALRDHICGDRAKNLEKAIAHFQAALEVRTRADFPLDWAMTQNSLGLALADRIYGDRAENLKRAITHFQAAISAYRELGLPDEERQGRRNLSRIRATLDDAGQRPTPL